MKKYDSYCFIDTNSFLHYKMFTEIDWNKLTNSKLVLLIVCPDVLRELEKKKNLDPDINIRNRARKVISKMAEIGSKSSFCKIKNDIDLMFIPDEPSVDWTNQGLNEKIVDDRIIASILTNNHLSNPILITSDFGLKLKARNKGIKCISVPKEHRIEIIKDNKNDEIVKLRNRVNFLENRLPITKLKILADSKPAEFINITLSKIATPSEGELNGKLKAIRHELQYKPSSQNLGIISDLILYTKDEIERYEEDLNEYIREMYKYYQEEYKFKEIQSRIIELKFLIINEGNQPAEDIEIFMVFPDGFEMFSEEEIPKRPKEPEKPIPPRSTIDMLSKISYMPKTAFPNLMIPSIDNVGINRNLSSGPHIRKKDSYEVNYRVDKLKHGIQKYLKPVYVLFESFDQAKPFNISYTILADNLPEPSNGNLHIVILKN
ncbi:MAG: PIN domain-containing protein [Promethearchaeota archaeon]